jgi:hypothetical protein
VACALSEATLCFAGAGRIQQQHSVSNKSDSGIAANGARAARAAPGTANCHGLWQLAKSLGPGTSGADPKILQCLSSDYYSASLDFTDEHCQNLEFYIQKPGSRTRITTACTCAME